MTLGQAAIWLSGAGVLAMGYLALMFLRDPVSGMTATTHRPEKLPEVMAGRYVAFTGLTVGAMLYGDLKVIAALFLAFAFMGFADAWIYARGGYASAKHVGAGVAGLLVAAVAVLALARGGGDLA